MQEAIPFPYLLFLHHKPNAIQVPCTLAVCSAVIQVAVVTLCVHAGGRCLFTRVLLHTHKEVAPLGLLL